MKTNTSMNPYQQKDLKAFVDSIPEEEIQRQNEKQEDRNRIVYQEFIDAMKSDTCFLCNRKMASFHMRKPCFHWFTYPPGIKKKHFTEYFGGTISYFQLEAYFRWLANYEKPIVNINDLKEDTSKSSFSESTIRYGRIEWSFSLGHSDLDGHKNSKFGKAPHYHLQMKRQLGDDFHASAYKGEGIGIIEEEGALEIIDSIMTVADDPSSAPFSVSTFVQAAKGHTLSGDVLADAIEESKRTKEPIGRILQRTMPDASITRIISPGDGVPEIKKRSGKK